FGTVLVANRGEIARRVFRACSALGLRTLAVYSEADRGALHVRDADAAVEIGGAPARESYLNAERILEAAREAGADAIHPGYGFLSESWRFAEAVQRAGIVFIGPRPDAIRKMGDKIQARRLMSAAGVSVLPGSFDAVADVAGAEAIAREVGYPIILKAAAGNEDRADGRRGRRRQGHRLDARGDDGVPRGRERGILLPRDERPAPGRASRHRGSDGARSRRRSASRGGGRAAAVAPERDRPAPSGDR